MTEVLDTFIPQPDVRERHETIAARGGNANHSRHVVNTSASE